MSIRSFATDLSDALARKPLPAKLINEEDFERRFILPVATRVVRKHRDVLLYMHPWSNKTCCAPNCVEGAPVKNGRVVGCPKCWRESKRWASVAAFGMHHTFDIVARDRRKKTVAIELKLTRAIGGRMPNGAMQRFLGQCLLAAAKHAFVIGIFGYHGRLKEKHRGDAEAVINTLKDLNVRLVLRGIE